jgi:hypothetical protein
MSHAEPIESARHRPGRAAPERRRYDGIGNRHGLVGYIDAVTARERIGELALSLWGQGVWMATMHRTPKPAATRHACADALAEASMLLELASKRLELLERHGQ